MTEKAYTELGGISKFHRVWCNKTRTLRELTQDEINEHFGVNYDPAVYTLVGSRFVQLEADPPGDGAAE